MEIEGREGRQIAVGIGVGPQWERAQSACVCVLVCARPGVCRPPLSIMKANQLGWQRRVLQEESQSTEPNEPGLEIRERQRRKRDRWKRARAMNSSAFG